MFNNPRFTGRVNYRFPPPGTITRTRTNEENNDEEEDEVNTSPDEEQMRQQAETFITNLTNLIARPNLNRIRYRNPRSSRRRFEQLLMHSFNQKPKYKKVLSEEGEQQLKKMLYKDSSKTNESCPIYYVDFEDDSEVIELPCKHCFTPAGIEKWLKDNKLEDTTLLSKMDLPKYSEEDGKTLRSLQIEFQNISENIKKINQNNHYRKELQNIDIHEHRRILALYPEVIDTAPYLTGLGTWKAEVMHEQIQRSKGHIVVRLGCMYFQASDVRGVSSLKCAVEHETSALVGAHGRHRHREVGALHLI